MELRTRLTNRGLELSLQSGDGPPPLTPSPDANQTNPRRSYIYAHLDSTGSIFYVGKGVGRRAWSRDRDTLWIRYVDKHLHGLYEVRILQDNLSPREAERLESDWIAQHSTQLVNWINIGDPTDMAASERARLHRNANRALIEDAKEMEKTDLMKAVAMYLRAIVAIRDYAFVHGRTGIVGQLLDEEAKLTGWSGEIAALDRLTMCLVKLDRGAEAAAHAWDYFATYALDLQQGAARRIAKRLAKATANLRRGAEDSVAEQGD